VSQQPVAAKQRKWMSTWDWCAPLAILLIRCSLEWPRKRGALLTVHIHHPPGAAQPVPVLAAIAGAAAVVHIRNGVACTQRGGVEG
jgi:hypothetical protein